MNKILAFLMTNKLVVIGIIVGAIAGYIYYSYVGCASGHCLITSKPLNSTIYGAAIGGLAFNIFKKPNKKKK